MADKIKPCPFCGKPPHESAFVEPSGSPRGVVIQLSCKNVNCSIKPNTRRTFTPGTETTPYTLLSYLKSNWNLVVANWNQRNED